jgi:serine/threonine protein kinase
MDNNLQIASISEYADILRTYGLEYKAVSPYWQVGEMNKVQGWIIHLSVVVHQLQQLLVLIVPELVGRGIPFKIVMDEERARRMVSGSLGYTQLGKMISIYPENDIIANELAKDLIKLTNPFQGPIVPTDRHLGSIVYARYGSFNAVEVVTSSGQPVKCIYNAREELIPDSYAVPFVLPEGVTWPFFEITAPSLPSPAKLLNGKYYPLTVIKPDAKGNVIRGLYFKKPWQICSCIIKQGNPHMFADEAGRDIRDRLKWQYDLYQHLHDDIPLPEVIDHFNIDGTTYLAMEFIKGIPFTSWISNIYADRSWLSLSPTERLLLIDKLLEILNIINRLHKRNYVHRDITPDNFLIDKKGRIFLVDMELSWSGKQSYPNPPFQLGTYGHMSPEQMAAQTPTVKEDIYALGGMIIIVCTNMHAQKFYQHSPEAMRDIICYFTGEEILGNLVAGCLQVSPKDRPTLESIQDTIQHYINTKSSQFSSANHIKQYPQIYLGAEELVQMGIKAMSNPEFLNPKQRWISLMMKDDAYIGNEQMELGLSEGWYTGMPGILWLVGRAKNMGFKVDNCMRPYDQSWTYLLEYFFPQIHSKSPGLYNGAAGIAMALTEGANAALLATDEVFRERVHSCFLTKGNSLCLATGIAGQGVALLNASKWIDKEFYESTLSTYITVILGAQQPDGSWPTGTISGRKGDVLTGMDYGISGITLFLMCYIKRHPDSQVEVATKKALDWLLKYRKKKNSSYGWLISTRSKEIDLWQYGIGTPGIVHIFIKAFEIWKNPLYKQIAEEALTSLPKNPSRMDWTLGTGLSGLGEVYLDAAMVFNNNKWKDRSDWITQLLTVCSLRTAGETVHWFPGYSTIATMDLFTGIGGLIYFFMSHLKEKQSSHPLSV